MTTDEARTVIFRALGDIAPEVDPAEVVLDVDLTEQLDLDSMDYLNWMLAINETTGIEIPERDYSKFMTIDAAASYLVQAAS